MRLLMYRYSNQNAVLLTHILLPNGIDIADNNTDKAFSCYYQYRCMLIRQFLFFTKSNINRHYISICDVHNVLLF